MSDYKQWTLSGVDYVEIPIKDLAALRSSLSAAEAEMDEIRALVYGGHPPTFSDRLQTLPAWARRYIADIETNADPANTVRSVAELRENCAALVLSLRAAEERAEAWVHAIAQKDSDIEHLRQQAEAAERDEDHAVIAARDAEAAAVAARDRAIAAEHRAEGLEEALGRLEWSFRQTALRNGGTIYTAICCPACMGEKDPPDDKGPRRKRGDPLPLAGHKADCWLSAALARPRSEDAPCDSTFTCRDGWHEIGCSKRPPAPVCTCKMPIGFGRSFRGFMAPDPNCAACSRPRSEETPTSPDNANREE